MEFKVNHLKEIDWEEVYPAEDIIIWQNLRWKFTDFVGHYPGAGTPVIESVSEEKRFFDTHNQIELKYYHFEDEFLGDLAEGEITFLLPLEWNEKRISEWFDQYKKDRAEQERVRREMLSVK